MSGRGVVSGPRKGLVLESVMWRLPSRVRVSAALPVIATTWLLVLTASSAIAQTPRRMLDLWTSPAGATITIDGSVVGRTPTVISVPVGRRQLVVEREGFARVERTLYLEAGPRMPIRLELARLGSSTVTVRFPRGVPSGLRVSVDGTALPDSNVVRTNSLIRVEVHPGRRIMELRSNGAAGWLAIDVPEVASRLTYELSEFVAGSAPGIPRPESLDETAVVQHPDGDEVVAQHSDAEPDPSREDVALSTCDVDSNCTSEMSSEADGGQPDSAARSSGRVPRAATAFANPTQAETPNHDVGESNSHNGSQWRLPSLQECDLTSMLASTENSGSECPQENPLVDVGANDRPIAASDFCATTHVRVGLSQDSARAACTPDGDGRESGGYRLARRPRDVLRIHVGISFTVQSDPAMAVDDWATQRAWRFARGWQTENYSLLDRDLVSEGGLALSLHPEVRVWRRRDWGVGLHLQWMGVSLLTPKSHDYSAASSLTISGVSIVPTLRISLMPIDRSAAALGEVCYVNCSGSPDAKRFELHLSLGVGYARYAARGVDPSAERLWRVWEDTPRGDLHYSFRYGSIDAVREYVVFELSPVDFSVWLGRLGFNLQIGLQYYRNVSTKACLSWDRRDTACWNPEPTSAHASESGFSPGMRDVVGLSIGLAMGSRL